MITIYPYETLGHRNFGWLDARYHFSFGDYHNADRMGFGALRVINDDTIKAGSGFDPHPHRDMEIITYVRKGAILHKDSLGHSGETAAGDVQVMSAGTGITHAEYSAPHEATRLYQIWIHPRERRVAPRWDSAQFPKAPVTDRLSLLVSGRAEDTGKGALYIHADAAIYGGRLPAGAALTHALKSKAYLLVSEGSVTAGDASLKQGDGASIEDLQSLSLTAGSDGAEILLIEIPD